MRQMRRFLRMIFPPKDLFALMCEAPIRAEGDDLIGNFPLWHKYEGPHEIGVICDHRIDNPVKGNGSVGFSVRFEDDRGNIVFENTGQTTTSMPWFDGPNKNGFSLIRYSVPESVPLRKPIQCRVTMIDSELALRRYCPISIYARNVDVP